ncbi:MAG: hypothetical protein ACYTA3_05675 [Planctomycetota bacterium]|jgi:hypothetical protein
MGEKPEITIYRDDDLVLAFCGTWGAYGVYRCWLNDDPGQIRWEFCPPESKTWDAYHQKVFRQHHAEACDDDLRAQLPPLPDGFPPPAALHVAEKAVPASVKPGRRVLQAVRAAPADRLAVFVVLSEDRYESIFGDGVFRYFEAAFADADAARAFVAKCSARAAKEAEAAGASVALGTVYHLRHVYLTLSGNKVTLDTEGAEEEAKVSPFDHFTAKQVCKDLAKRLRRRWIG